MCALALHWLPALSQSWFAKLGSEDIQDGAMAPQQTGYWYVWANKDGTFPPAATVPMLLVIGLSTGTHLGSSQ